VRGERRSKAFATAREARDWRIRMLAASRHRRRAVATRETLRDAAEAYVGGMRSGTVKNRSGDIYKPKVVRDYESTLRLYVLPDLGGRRISDIRPPDLQRLVERIAGTGMSPSTIRKGDQPGAGDLLAGDAARPRARRSDGRHRPAERPQSVA
jgi:hypothetical protein